MDGVRNIVELQDQLDGVFDLNELEDCRKIIGVLLRNNSEKEAAAIQSKDQLRLLAMMVINGNPEAREKAREVMATSGSKKKDVMAFLQNMVCGMDEAESFTNEKLIDEVTDTVWSGLDMSSRESAVLGEMIHRMKKFTGSSAS